MKHIGIIGAGISGLATAKAFLQQGHHVTILEKAAGIGGVWEKSRSYLGVATQTTRDEYAFSDFPMPAHYPQWPSGEQVQRYLEDYAAHFGVSQHIRFNTIVRSLRYEGGGWRVDTENTITGLSGALHVDFMVVCSGTFHQPHIPSFPGMDGFTGRVLHSSQVNDPAILENKKVMVVGFAKSATDIATLAAGRSAECALVYRKAQWKVPRHFGKLINMRYLLFSRFSEAFFDAPHKTSFQRFLHSAGKPLVWAQWRGLELLLKTQFGLKACNMVPQHRIEDQISCSLGVAPEGFYENVREGKIKAKQTEIEGFSGNTVKLRNGDTLQPDVVVFGTGFTQSMPFLEPRHAAAITGPDGVFRLYRNILHPDVPQLGFVGFNSSLFTTLTSEIAAQWLVRYADGAMPLPGRQEMQRDMEFMASWRKSGRPIASEFSGTCVAPFNFMHIDQLMRDMGLRTKATRFGLYEFFKPINPKDYRTLLGNAAKRAPVPQGPVYRTVPISH
ncbi:flavin-containing monooxygenase [Chitinophaga lutea]